MSLTKFLSVFLALIYTSVQVVFGSLAEASIWKERHRQMTASREAKPSQLLASLPSVAPAPIISNKNETVSLPTIASTPKNPFQSLLNVLPNDKVSIQSVHRTDSDSAPVVILQDIHRNVEAQMNLAAALQNLINGEALSVVGVEGAYDEINFAPFQAFSNKELTKEVARAFVEAHRLAAPSYVGITSQRPLPIFVGMDNQKQHEANIEAYRSSLKKEAVVQDRLKVMVESINEGKRTINNKKLVSFLDFQSALDQNKIELGPYLRQLASMGTEVPLSIQQFNEAYHLESRMDFKRVERERKIILEKLVPRLSEQETTALVSMSVSYRTGQLSYAEFYGRLRSLCLKHKVPLEFTPHFNDYLQYVLLSDGIKASMLFDEVRQLEANVIKALVTTQAEQQLVQDVSQHRLIKKLVQFQLTPKDWEEYKVVYGLKKDNLFTSFEDFYRHADDRSDEMVKALVKKESKKSTALIVGGFHTERITEHLKEKDYAYIVLSPKLTKVDAESGSLYLTEFAKEKTPLDRLFAGEKLFVNAPDVNVSFPATNNRIRAWTAGLHHLRTGFVGLLRGTGTRVEATEDTPIPAANVTYETADGERSILLSMGEVGGDYQEVAGDQILGVTGYASIAGEEKRGWAVIWESLFSYPIFILMARGLVLRATGRDWDGSTTITAWFGSFLSAGLFIGGLALGQVALLVAAVSLWSVVSGFIFGTSHFNHTVGQRVVLAFVGAAFAAISFTPLLLSLAGLLPVSGSIGIIVSLVAGWLGNTLFHAIYNFIIVPVIRSLGRGLNKLWENKVIRFLITWPFAIASAIPSATREKREELTLDIDYDQLGRRVENLMAELYYKYGELDEEVPEQKAVLDYVQEVFREAMGAEADDYEIVIFPEWNEVNAMALPAVRNQDDQSQVVEKGKIIIGFGILRFLQYKEELQAVLMHEAMHIKRRHAEIKKHIANRMSEYTKNVDGFMKLAGLSRSNEYEADLRWIIEQMRKRNVNPYGQVSLFEKFQILEERRGYRERGVTHGDTGDRALNTESLFFYLPIPTLRRGLTLLPEDWITKAKVKREDSRIFFRSGFAGDSSSELDQLQEARNKAALESPIEEMGFAISELGEEGAKTTLAKAKKSNGQVMRLLTRIVDKELISKEKWPTDRKRRLARILYYKFFTSVPYLMEQDDRGRHQKQLKALKERMDEDKEELNSFKDAKEMVEIMMSEEFLGLETPFIDERPHKVLEEVIDYIVELKGGYRGLTENDVIEFYEMAEYFSQQSVSLYEKKGLRVFPADKVFYELTSTMARRLSSRNQSALVEALQSRVNSSVIYQEKDQEELGVKQRIGELEKELYLSTKKGKSFSLDEYGDLLNRLHGEVVGGSPTAIFNAFTHLIAQHGHMKEALNIDAEGRNETQNRRLAQARYFGLRLFEEALNSWDEFKSLNNDQKAYLRRSYFLGHVYSGAMSGHTGALVQGPNGQWISPLQSVDLYTDDPVVEEKEYSYLSKDDFSHFEERYALNIESEWFSPKWTRKRIASVYQFHDQLRNDPSFNGPESTKSRFDHIFNLILSKYLKPHAKDWNSFFKELEALEKAGIPIKKLIGDHPNEFSFVTSDLWKSLPNRPNKAQQGQILEAVEFIEDPILRSDLISYYFLKVWPRLDFNERLDALFAGIRSGAFDLNRFNEFIETEMQTQEQFEAVKNKVGNEIDVFMTQGSAKAGVAAILSNMTFSDTMNHDLLLALMKSAESDTDLRRLIYESLDYTFSLTDGNIDNVGRFTYLNSLDSEHIDQERTVELINMKLSWADRVERQLLGMSTMGKSALLRRLMTGRNGLISTKKQRKVFLKSLIDVSVKQNGEDANLVQMMRHVSTGLGEIDTWKPLYFALQSVLTNRIGGRPAEMTPWKAVVDDHGIDDLGPRYQEKINDSESQDIRFYEQNASKSSGTFWRNPRVFTDLAGQRLKAILEKRGIKTPPTESAVMSPLNFILEVVQNTGSMGVRFLQVLPQFAKIQDKYLDAFSKVFDSMQGQSKLVAIQTLEDNWPNFWDEVESVGDRIGGGSLMTVFVLNMKDGTRKAVKVKNPNIEYLMETNMEMIRELLDYMIDKMNLGPEYETARQVLEEVREWISRDVNFEDFLAKDKIFAEANRGYTVDGLGYEIGVPQSYGPESEWFMVEDFVDDAFGGGNLTKWDELVDAGHDMKAVVGLVTNNYLSQWPRGQIHSDAHIGNFRVYWDVKEQKYKVMILDRSFFLELTPEMNNVIQPMGELLTMMAQPAGEFVDQLIGASGQTVKKAQRTKIVNAWDRQRKAVADGSWTLEGFKEDVNLFVDLIPEARDFVEYWLNPSFSDFAVEPDEFVDKLILLSKSTIKGPQRAKVIGAWTTARNGLLTGDMSELRAFMRQLPELLELKQNVSNVLTKIIDVMSLATETPEEFVNRLIEIAKNQSLAREKKQALVEAWKTTREEIRKGNWEALNEFILDMRLQGIELPLEVTLILKNVSSLQQMAINAGFSNGIIGALAYRGEEGGAPKEPKVSTQSRKPAGDKPQRQTRPKKKDNKKLSWFPESSIYTKWGVAIESVLLSALVGVVLFMVIANSWLTGVGGWGLFFVLSLIPTLLWVGSHSLIDRLRGMNYRRDYKKLFINSFLLHVISFVALFVSIFIISAIDGSLFWAGLPAFSVAHIISHVVYNQQISPELIPLYAPSAFEDRLPFFDGLQPGDPFRFVYKRVSFDDIRPIEGNLVSYHFKQEGNRHTINFEDPKTGKLYKLEFGAHGDGAGIQILAERKLSGSPKSRDWKKLGHAFDPFSPETVVSFLRGGEKTVAAAWYRVLPPTYQADVRRLLNEKEKRLLLDAIELETILDEATREARGDISYREYVASLRKWISVYEEDLDAVFDIGFDLEIKAHGIELAKGGLSSLISIFYDGKIKIKEAISIGEGDIAGGLHKRGQSNLNAGSHGPFYILLRRHAGGEWNDRNAFIGILVPTETERAILTLSLRKMAEKELIPSEDAEGLIEKIVTYKEFAEAGNAVRSAEDEFIPLGPDASELIVEKVQESKQSDLSFFKNRTYARNWAWIESVILFGGFAFLPDPVMTVELTALLFVVFFMFNFVFVGMHFLIDALFEADRDPPLIPFKILEENAFQVHEKHGYLLRWSDLRRWLGSFEMNQVSQLFSQISHEFALVAHLAENGSTFGLNPPTIGAWYEYMIKDGKDIYFLVGRDGKMKSVVRIDGLEGEDVEISSLASREPGNGWGDILLEATMDDMKAKNIIRPFLMIRPESEEAVGQFLASRNIEFDKDAFENRGPLVQINLELETYEPKSKETSLSRNWAVMAAGVIILHITSFAVAFLFYSSPSSFVLAYVAVHAVGHFIWNRFVKNSALLSFVRGEPSSNPAVDSVVDAVVAIGLEFIRNKQRGVSVAQFVDDILPGNTLLNQHVSTIQGHPQGLLGLLRQFDSVSNEILIDTLQRRLADDVDAGAIQPSEVGALLQKLSEFGLPVQSVDAILSQAKLNDKEATLVLKTSTQAGLARSLAQRVGEGQVINWVVAQDDMNYYRQLRRQLMTQIPGLQIELYQQSDSLYNNDGVLNILSLRQSRGSRGNLDLSRSQLILPSGTAVDTSGLTTSELQNIAIFFLNELLSGVTMTGTDLRMLERMRLIMIQA